MSKKRECEWCGSEQLRIDKGRGQRLCADCYIEHLGRVAKIFEIVDPEGETYKDLRAQILKEQGR